MRTKSAWFACVLALVSLTCSARAEELNVAVAANFLGTLQKLATQFQKAHGHTIVPSPGSTGQLYAQIQKGAPYDVLLSADTERPAKLEADGLAVKGSRFTYAVGQLILWSPKPGVVDPAGDVLKKSELTFVAYADPKAAPYGVAAEQVLTALKLLEPLRTQKKIVLGESVGQAHQFATSGHAEVAFVALSQVIDASGKVPGSSWQVPGKLYTQIDQDAVVLKATQKAKVAELFVHWLRTDRAALETIRSSGYATPTKQGASTAAK